MKCLVVLPCYDERENLKQLIPKIDETLSDAVQYKVVAVNDGSRDNTSGLLKELSNEYPIIAMEHETNKGLSEALFTGLEAALRNSDEDLIITTDSDNTHDPTYILDMLRAAKARASTLNGGKDNRI